MKQRINTVKEEWKKLLTFGALGWVKSSQIWREMAAPLIPPEASPHRRRLKCDTKHQSQEADATFITSDGSKPYKPWRTLDTDNDNN